MIYLNGKCERSILIFQFVENKLSLGRWNEVQEKSTMLRFRFRMKNQGGSALSLTPFLKVSNDFSLCPNGKNQKGELKQNWVNTTVDAW